MARKNQGRGPKQRIRDADKRREALILFRRGLSYAEIAKDMGYANRSAPHNLIRCALEDLWVEPAEEVLKIELARLDKMLEGLTRSQSGGGECGPELGGAFDGNPKAITAAIKIMDRRAKYLGLDAPVKQELSGANGGPISLSIEDLEAAQAAMMANADGADGDKRKPS